MIKRIELLVHAGAPSNRKDDERYRAQAQAYAAFEASVTIPLAKSTPSDQDVQERIRIQDNALEKAIIGAGHASELFLDDTQLAYTALDSQLLTPSLLHSPDGHSDAGTTPEKPHVVASFAEPRGTKRKRNTRSENEGDSHSPTGVGRNAGLEMENAISTRESPRLANGSTTSSYLKSPMLQRANKKAKRDTHPGRSSSKPVTHGRVHNGADISSRQPEQAMRKSDPNDDFVDPSHDSTGGNQTTSELPTSYSLSDITSGSSKARQNISQRSTSDPGPQIGSISPTALRVVPTPRKADHQRLETCSGSEPNHGRPPSSAPEVINLDRMPKPKLANPRNDRTTLRASDPRIPAPPDVQELDGKPAVPSPRLIRAPQKQSAVAPDAQQEVHVLTSLSASVRPPQPPSAVAQYKTHITQSLQFLADNSDVNISYKPISVSRDIRPLERGYWFIQCPEVSTFWPLREQIEFWRFLEQTVGRGDAGWGVWCTRNDEEPSANDGEASLGTVKVFCWGEIVRHVFLLLYVGSKSKIKKLGLQWIDAEEKVVVQMRAG